MTHIAYKGGAPAIADLLGDQIPIVSSTASEFLDLHKAGKLRVIEKKSAKTAVPVMSQSSTRNVFDNLKLSVAKNVAPKSNRMLGRSVEPVMLY